MSFCLITGNHPRHRFLAKALLETGLLRGWVVEEREAFVPSPPGGLHNGLSELFRYHFKERDRIETEVFGDRQPELGIPTLRVSREDLNGPEVQRFLRDNQPKIVFSYGCHKLSESLMNAMSSTFWNCHGGLSPEYRGVITHFWPSYLLEPQMTGMTLHETSNEIDGGRILMTTGTPMVQGDTLHRLAARAVETFTQELIERVTTLDFENLPTGVPQHGYGRVFLQRDWRPEHLKLIYEIYEDKIVDAVLRHELAGRHPKLVDAFNVNQ